jgi:putative radical SAM enzyme (TIGR03279 family)
LLEIESILPDSTAARLGLKPGDILDSINKHEVRDVIDYQFLVADEHIRIVFHTKSGKSGTLNVVKDPDDNLGISFSPFPITRCRNHCIFCFVNQMPAGCRKSLYIKDDDYRASFLYGNYITLGALSEKDWERIFNQRLSPLYISVHTTDPALRSFMLRNKKSPDIMESMKRLAAGGIRMHTQVVLCPGINDGAHLRKTVEDLSGLFPAVSSIAVVPVGLTKYRKDLFPLRTFTRSEARAVVDQITAMGTQFRRQFGTRLVFVSDEFYIRSGEVVPPASFYEDFPQRENGVGMVAAFLKEVSRIRMPKQFPKLRITAITGVSFSGILKKALARVNKVSGVRIDVVTVPNIFFGPTVTVAGLLTGRDILRALRNKRVGDIVLVPANALKEDEEVFLDGMTVEQLERSLNVRVEKGEGFKHLISILRGQGGRAG